MSSSSTQQGISRHIMVVLAIAIFLTAMALIILQNVLGSNAPKVLQGYNNGYADGYRDARMAFGGTAGTELGITSMTAEVLEVSAGTLRVNALNPTFNERVDGVSAERRITLAEGATVQFQTRVPEEDYLRASRAWDPRSDNPPPSPFTLAEGSVSDIQVGDLITVMSSEDQDLRTAASFTVTSLTVIDPLVIESPTPISVPALPTEPPPQQ